MDAMGALYVVATPIGNLDDITARAVLTLKSVDLIACEDTRHTKVLLDRYGVKTDYVSYHQHSSLQKIDWLVAQLRQGRKIALVTDAGTPGISDPGGILVEKIHLLNRDGVKPISIISVPGPSSLTTALSVSGFACDTFMFFGFLPKKKGRQTLLVRLRTLVETKVVQTFVFFESARRINKSLVNLAETFAEDSGKIEVCLCRELTKKFEEIWRGNLDEAIIKTSVAHKGEFVVVVHYRERLKIG